MEGRGDMEERRPQPGEFYRHFKNKLYQIIGIAVHSETGEKLVIYQALYGEFGIYARPLSMFVSEVDHEKYPEVTQKYRFQRVNPGHQVQAGSKTVVQDGEVRYDSEPETDRKQDMSDTEFPAQGREAEGQQSNNADGQEEADAQLCDAAVQEASEKRMQILMEFLDCDSYEEKLEYFHGVKKQLNDKLINDMSFAMDIVIEEGELEDRILSFENCLKTFRKFECNRLR